MHGNNKHTRFVVVVTTGGRAQVASAVLVSVYFLRWVEDTWVSIMYFINFMSYITTKTKKPSSFCYNKVVQIFY